MKKDFSYYVFLTLGILTGDLIGMWIFDSINPKVVKNTVKADSCKVDTIFVHDTIRFSK